MSGQTELARQLNNVQSELERIQQGKQAIIDSIEYFGIDVPSGAKIDSLYTYIDMIGTIYVSKTELATILEDYMLKPDVIYETDGTTGLLGENAGSLTLTTWQLENLDFSDYKYVRAYIKQADLPLSGTNNIYATPSVIVNIPLDTASRSTEYDAYVGAGAGTNMNDPDVHFTVLCAIDSTKTKFKVVSECSIAGTIMGDRNNRGRYCYKIEGYK